MADPTPDQLAGFFAAASLLRTIFSRVDIIFRGANALPDVVTYWSPTGGQVIGRVVAENQSADEIIAAMNALYTTYAQEDQLRNQLAAAEQQVTDLRNQLGLR